MCTRLADQLTAGPPVPPESGGDQEGADLVAVQGGGVRLVVQSRSADVGGRGVVKEFFLDGVLVEAGDGAQPPSDGGAGTARPRSERAPCRL